MNQDKAAQLEKKKKLILQGGGKKRIDQQHSKGKLTARERLNILLDPDSFSEIDSFVTHRSTNFGLDKVEALGDGVITGFGQIDDRLVYVYAQDFTILGGSLGEMHAKKICKIMDLALQNNAPIIGINDSGGARIQEGVNSLAGYADIFYRNTLCSGVIPQLSVILGPCAGGAVYSPGITDFIFMVDDISHMFITGPNVIKEVTGENVTFEKLGGSKVHSEESGVAHFSSSSEEEALLLLRELFSFLPQNNLSEPPSIPASDVIDEIDLTNIIPENPDEPYDMNNLITKIVDNGVFFQIHEKWAKNILIGFARLNGNSIGIIANQPDVLAGCLDINSSIKAARFVRFCDAFNIPLVTFVDVPGFLPGSDQEHDGIIKHGSQLLYAFAEATVPRITVIIRKAYGGAYCVMNSKQIGSDLNYAWPSAEIAVMGSKSAIQILKKNELNQSKNESIKNKLIKDYEEKFANPYTAANMGYIDDVIDPSQTRTKIILGLESLIEKTSPRPQKKHGNIPL